MSTLPRRPARGFTLIEVMIAVLIVGILASIAVPAYRSQVIKVKRADAKVELTTAAQRMERCFTRGNTYVGCATGYPLTTTDGTYTIAIDIPDATSFTASATPLGAQAKDTACGTFSINEVGAQAVTGPYGAAECW